MTEVNSTRLPAGRTGFWSGRVGPDVLGPIAIRVGAMLIQLVLLAALNGRGPSLLDRLTKWDGHYYEQLTSAGYPHGLQLNADGSVLHGGELAFYPLYPALAAAVRAVTGLPVDLALLTTAALAGLAASILVHLLAVELTGSRRVGYLACGLLGALPMSIVLQMAYAESLYVALAAAVLLLARRGRWWPATICAFAAGLARPTGFVVVLAIPLAAWWAYRRPVEERGERPGRPTMSVPTLIGTSAVGVSGGLVYWAYLRVHTGSWTTWFTAEKDGWDSHFDFGVQTFRFLRTTLAHPSGLVGLFAAVSMLLYLLGGVAVVAARQWWPLVAVSVVSIFVSLAATNFWHSKPRLLLAAFPLVVPAARGLARLPIQLAALIVLAGTVTSAWFGAYLLDVWPYAI